MSKLNAIQLDNLTVFTAKDKETSKLVCFRVHENMTGYLEQFALYVVLKTYSEECICHEITFCKIKMSAHKRL